MSGRIISTLLKYRVLLSAVTSSACFFLFYLVSPTPSYNRFSATFSQTELSGIIFVLVCAVFGFSYDRDRNNGVSNRDNVISRNPYFVLYGVCSFLCIPFVFLNYIHVLSFDDLFVAMKFLSLLSTFITTIFIILYKDCFHRFVLSEIPFRLRLKNASLYFVVLSLASIFFYFCFRFVLKYSEPSSPDAILLYCAWMGSQVSVGVLSVVVFNFLRFVKG